jgi:hypothetical protein
MARTSKKHYLESYKRRIAQAQKWRDQEGYDDLWGRMTDLYRGKHFESIAAEDRIAVNVAFGTINVIYPSVSVNYPKVTVNPTKPEFVLPAETAEGMVNYYWKHFDFHEPFRRATKDFLIFGHGWLKVGWRYKEQEQALGEDALAEAYEQQVAEATEFAALQPELAGGLPTDEEIAANLPETEMVVVEDRPFVERVSPYDVLVDPEATCLADADFIAQKIVRPLSEAKKDKRYSASARNKLTSDHVAATQSAERRRRNREDPEVERTTIWEFYDLRNGTMSVCGEGADEFLVDPRPMPYAFGHPFVMLANYEVPDHFYPLGDLEAIEPLQQELNKVRSQMMNVRKHFARKYLFKESAFGPEGRQALESDVDMTMVPVVDEQSPFSDLIAPMPQINVPPEIYNHSATIEDDISQVSGVSEYQRGQVPETRRTATEAAIISDSVNARAADKLAIIEKAIANVGRRVVQLCQQYVTGDHVIRVMGEDNAVSWLEFDRETIQGEFDFEVEAGSTQPMNETARRQQAVALMNALGPLIGVVIDPAKVAAHVLQHGFGIKDPSQFMMAMPMMPPGPEGGSAPTPGGEPGMQEPPMGDTQSGGPGGSAPGGIPPEILNQLAGQIGLG